MRIYVEQLLATGKTRTYTLWTLIAFLAERVNSTFITDLLVKYIAQTCSWQRVIVSVTLMILLQRLSLRHPSVNVTTLERQICLKNS